MVGNSIEYGKHLGFVPSDWSKALSVCPREWLMRVSSVVSLHQHLIQGFQQKEMEEKIQSGLEVSNVCV